jgi:hypothetical protein
VRQKSPSKQREPSNQIGDPQIRYRWSTPCDLPDRCELIDQITRQSAGIVLTINQQFDWKRNTSTMIHGTPPAQGTCTTLREAQSKVMEGLRNEM